FLQPPEALPIQSIFTGFPQYKCVLFHRQAPRYARRTLQSRRSDRRGLSPTATLPASPFSTPSPPGFQLDRWSSLILSFEVRGGALIPHGMMNYLKKENRMTKTLYLIILLAVACLA